MNALIFAGGRFSSLPEQVKLSEYDFFIAADSGYLNAEALGIIPDIFVGDFDSVTEEQVKSKERVRLFPVKDMTDTQEAIDIAISRGAKKITILGALGGRIDHTTANLHLLKYGKSKGVSIDIQDTDTSICLVPDELDVKKQEGFCLSLIPLTDCTGVSISGVFYPLRDASMPVGNPYGISNEFVDDIAHIKVKTGDLLLMLVKS